jgi:hypothetical protein
MPAGPGKVPLVGGLVLALAICCTPVWSRQVASAPAQGPDPAWAESLAAESEAINAETARVRQQAADLRARMQSLEEKIGLLGLNEGNRILLTEYRRTLPAVTASQQRIAWAGTEMRLTSLEVQRLAKLTAASPSSSAAPNGADPAFAAGSVSASTASGTTAAIEALQQYALALGLLASEHNHLLDSIEAMRSFTDRQLLWVPSAAPVGPGDFVRVVDGAIVLARPGPWAELGQRLLGRLMAEPWQFLVVAGMVAGSVWLTRRLDQLSRARSANRAKSQMPDAPTALEGTSV